MALTCARGGPIAANLSPRAGLTLVVGKRARSGRGRVRRGSRWAGRLTGQGVFASLSVAGGVGAAIGALVALVSASGETRLSDADSGAAVGLALGGGVGLVVWACCRVLAGGIVAKGLGDEALFETFRRE